MDNYKPYDVTDEDRVKYAEEKLGVTIDPNQDWVLTDECNVTINADASLEGISMVAVLDGNPYAGITQVMASSPSSRDAKTSLSFRAPQGAEYLYAACMTNDGKCVARPFVPGQETTVSFKEAPVAYSQVASTRATEMVIVNPPTYANFFIKDFVNFRKALFENLPDKTDNRDKLSDASSVIRVKANDFNFYELPLVFLGGIGRDNNESDNDNLAYYWHKSDDVSQSLFLLKDRFKNAFQPKYDGDTKSYIVEGMYPVAKGQDGKNTIQFSADDVLDLQLADGETFFSHNEIRVMVFYMNDCVIEVQENPADNSKLDITLVALGGSRELWLGFENKNARSYADYQHVFEQELHEVLGIPVGKMANTGNGTLTVDPVKITLPKPEGFNFQTCSFILGARVKDDMRGVYENDYYAISIPRKGQDPHGIVIPGKWQWPTETTCITDAYLKFADWAHDIKNPTAKNWYMFPESGKVVDKIKE